jgi:hypothetical protein
MLAILSRTLRAALLAVAATCVLSAGLAAAQLGNPSGPGQSVPAPPEQCPMTTGCQYAERNYLPDGYRFQMLVVCGASCTSQYWVTNIPDGQLLFTMEPVRGGGIVAVGPAPDPQDMHPPVRTIFPDYGPTDAACCPSQYQDLTYAWDAGSNTLVAGTPTVIAAADFGGWDNLRQSLQAEQFFEVFPSLGS